MTPAEQPEVASGPSRPGTWGAVFYPVGRSEFDSIAMARFPFRPNDGGRERLTVEMRVAPQKPIVAELHLHIEVVTWPN